MAKITHMVDENQLSKTVDSCPKCGEQPDVKLKTFDFNQEQRIIIHHCGYSVNYPTPIRALEAWNTYANGKSN